MISHMLRGRRYLRMWPFAWALAFSSAIQAQTLDEQYEIYLPRKCEAMNFARDGFDILPGQAGPNLFALCNGAHSEPNNGPTVVVTPMAGVNTVGGREASLDKALRERRDELRDEDTASFGANGVFVSLDGRNEEQEVTRYEGGRDVDQTVLTLGADRRFGARALAGIALRREDSDGSFSGGGGVESRAYGASLYGSWLPLPGLFVDLTAGYGKQQLDIERIVTRRIVSYDNPPITIPPTPPSPPTITYVPPPTLVGGSTDARETSADIVIGYDVFLWRVNVGPRVGASTKRVEVDAYTEAGNTFLALAFHERVTRSFRSTVGLLASAPFTVMGFIVTPQLDVNWLHEFSDDQQLLSAHFAEDLRPNPTKLVFLNQAPDRNTFNARLSVAVTLPHGLSAFVAAQKLFAHDYREQVGASIGVRWEL